MAEAATNIGIETYASSVKHPLYKMIHQHRDWEEFLEFIGHLPRTEKGCALWPGRRWGDGYPLVFVEGKWQRGNRAALAAFLQRPLDKKKLECHHCDTPLCINPGHLFEGTNQENQSDMAHKGRAASGLRNARYTKPERTARGSRNCNATLTQDQVNEIVRLLEDGVSKLELSSRFSTSTKTVDRIRQGIHWGTGYVRPRNKY